MNCDVNSVHKVYAEVSFTIHNKKFSLNGFYELFDDGHDPKIRALKTYKIKINENYKKSLNLNDFNSKIEIKVLNVVRQCKIRSAKYNFTTNVCLIISNLVLMFKSENNVKNVHLNLNNNKIKSLHLYVKDFYAQGSVSGVFEGVVYDFVQFGRPVEHEPGKLSYIVKLTFPSEFEMNLANENSMLDYIEQFQSILSFAMCGPCRVTCIHGIDINNKFVFWHYTGYCLRAERRSITLIPKDVTVLRDFISDVYLKYKKYRNTMDLDVVFSYFWKGKYDQHLHSCFIYHSVVMESLKYHCSLNYLSVDPNFNLKLCNNGKFQILKNGKYKDATFRELLTMTFNYFGLKPTNSDYPFDFVDNRNSLFHTGNAKNQYGNTLSYINDFGDDWGKLTMQVVCILFKILDYKGEFISFADPDLQLRVDNYNWDNFL